MLRATGICVRYGIAQQSRRAYCVSPALYDKKKGEKEKPGFFKQIFDDAKELSKRIQEDLDKLEKDMEKELNDVKKKSNDQENSAKKEPENVDDDKNTDKNEKTQKKFKMQIGPFEISANMKEPEKFSDALNDLKREKLKKDFKEDFKEDAEKDKDRRKKVVDDRMSEMMNKAMGVNSLKYDIVMPDSKDTMSFKDVGGHYEAKVELMEVVDFLKNPEKYQNLGAKVPSGALLTGPPGNGKTLLAKAIAGESQVPFISTAGPQFIEKIGGLGAKRVRDLFEKAREMSPCILFIDELDAIGKRNDPGFGMEGAPGGMEESDQVINQFLVELDGLSTRTGEVFVIGATNRDQKIDKALMRSGRLERKIYIDLPTLSERGEIFKLNLLKIKSNFNLDNQATRLALLTPSYSGADVANIVNEAAIQAASNGQTVVEAHNFEHAIERVIAGLERRSHSVTKDETKISAYYEASQALVGWVLPKGDKVLKMSVKPRVQSNMGFMQLEPQLDHLHSKERLLDMICQTLAGRAGEALFFDHLTNRADSDLKKANNVVNKMVTIYGMGESAANLSFPPGPNPRIKPYSNSLQKKMDAEIHAMLSDAYKKSFEVVSQYKTEVEFLAEALIEKQVLNEDDIAKILANVPTTRPVKFNKTQGR